MQIFCFSEQPGWATFDCVPMIGTSWFSFRGSVLLFPSSFLPLSSSVVLLLWRFASLYAETMEPSSWANLSPLLPSLLLKCPFHCIQFVIKTRPHKTFRREGDDLHMDFTISLVSKSPERLAVHTFECSKTVLLAMLLCRCRGASLSSPNCSVPRSFLKQAVQAGRASSSGSSKASCFCRLMLLLGSRKTSPTWTDTRWPLDLRCVRLESSLLPLVSIRYYRWFPCDTFTEHGWLQLLFPIGGELH